LRAKLVGYRARKFEPAVYASRSATIHAAIRLLRDRGYQDSYAVAWREWSDDGEEAVWDATAADGLR
jgi:Arc/MetJ-type ribon-helix-helix transcriptional regulator